jgi:hypothetical protein
VDSASETSIVFNGQSLTGTMKYQMMHMKLLGLVVLFLLAGCVARTPLAELEAEAALTGDWSAVERHERMSRKMGLDVGGTQCRSGHVLVCATKGSRNECGCVSPLDRGLRQ